ncbi:MAG: FtsX-like permease family protein [bacterium]|nr:FtsX-like permease family protein [Candidatus Sumerlaeota bacterium]
MNYLTFAYKNGLRNKRRTALTAISIAFSLFVLGTLITIVNFFDMPQTDDSVLRLAITRSTSIADPLPASYENKIRGVPGVRIAMPFTWFQGVWREEEKNMFPNFGCNPRVVFDMFREIVISPSQKEAFIREKNAAAVGKLTADHFGWKLGDRINLVSQIWATPDGVPVELELVVRAIFTSTISGPDTHLYFHHNYFDEAAGRIGAVGSYWVKVNSISDIPSVSAMIDSMFKNTSAETRTETEKAFGASFVAMLGNVKALLASISTVVVITILLVVASTMAMSIRERAAEIAVLKTLGFKRGLILFLLISESVVISLVGGAIGMAGGRSFFGSIDINKLTAGNIPFFQIEWRTVGICMIAALALGVASAALPAYFAVRQSVLSGLRRIV